MMVERRKMLGFVSDTTNLMGEQYNSKAEAQQTRMEAHEVMDNSIKIWSTKI